MSAQPGTGVTILLLGAGSARRMRGADKLLEPIDGVPLLRRQATAALATGCAVVVTLPPNATGRLRTLEGLPVAVIEVPHAHLGMGESLRIGAGAAGTPEGLMVMLADMPDIDTEDLDRLLADFTANPTALIRATTEDGTPGHPVIFPADCLPAFRALSGDTGARAVLRANAARIRMVALPGRRATTDLDTPEAWAAWRATRS